MFAEVLREKLAGIVVLSDEQVSALEAHYDRMVVWNRTMNLTTVSGVGEAVERHYCEGLFLGGMLSEAVGQRIVDIGSGAGFPGYPVAVLRPEDSVTLVESHQRKAVFLKEASRKQGNVRVLAKRAEDVGETFDWVISRAVSYRDLKGNLGRLGGKAALLTGAEEPPEELGVRWEAAVALPWGRHRFVRIGSVSRETAGK